MGTTKAGSWFLSIPTYERSTLSAFSGLIVLKMLIVHKNTTQRKEKDEVFIMLTREQKETMLNQILELMTAIAYDEPVENAPAPTEKKSEKVKMLTVKECTELIEGLSEHTVRMLVAQNKIKYIRTGEGVRGKILVNKADLLNYFQN